MIVVIGLIVAFILVVLLSNRATRACRWREYRGNQGSTWRCVQCGAEVQGDAGQPPKLCHKPD